MHSRCRWVKENCLWGGNVSHICSHLMPIRLWGGTLVQQFQFSFKFPFSKAVIFCLTAYPAEIASFSSTNWIFSTSYGLCKYVHGKIIVYLSISPSFTLLDHFSSTDWGLSKCVWLVLLRRKKLSASKISSTSHMFTPHANLKVTRYAPRAILVFVHISTFRSCLMSCPAACTCFTSPNPELSNAVRLV